MAAANVHHPTSTGHDHVVGFAARCGGKRRFSELLRPPVLPHQRPPSPFAREAEGTAERPAPGQESDTEEPLVGSARHGRRVREQLSLGSDGTLSRSLSSPELLQLPALLAELHCPLLPPTPSTETPSPLPTANDLAPLIGASKLAAQSANNNNNNTSIPLNFLSSASSLQSLKGHAAAVQQQILRPKMQLNGSSILSIDIGRLGIKGSSSNTSSNCLTSSAPTTERQRRSSGGSVQSDTRRNLISLTTSVGNALQRTKRELQRTRLWHAFYALALPVYTLVGALLFQALDGEHDDRQRELYERRCLDGREARMDGLEKLCSGGGEQCFREMRALLAQVEDCYRRWHEVNRTTTHPMSDFTNAIIYAFSVYTTIGYGTISASSMSARIATVFYGVFGIPLFFAFIKEEGNMFRNVFIYIYNRVKMHWRRRMAANNLPQPLRRLSFIACRPPALRTKSKESSSRESRAEETAPLAAISSRDSDIATVENGGPVAEGEGTSSAKKSARFSNQYSRQCSDMSLPLGWKGCSVASSTTLPRKQRDGNRRVSAGGDCGSAAEQRRVFLCGVLVFLIYLLTVSALFSLMTGWDFFTSFYFLFNSVALIGFGDVFPSQSSIILVNMFLIVLGVVLFSMCYFILQEEIRVKAFEASRKARMSITKYSQSLMLHTRPWSRRNSPAFDKGSPMANGGQFSRLRKRRQSAPAISAELERRSRSPQLRV